MAYRFLHIGFTFNGPPRMRDLEPIFSSSGDQWLRYSAGSWIVWTEKSVSDWYAIVKPHIATSEFVLIVGLDMTERNGWQPQYIWDWIDSKRGIPRNYIAELLALQPLLKKP